MMTLLYLVMALTLVTLVAWLANTYVPMPGNIKTVVNVVLALLVVLFLFAMLMRSIRQRRLAQRASPARVEVIETPQAQESKARQDTGPMLIPE